VARPKTLIRRGPQVPDFTLQKFLKFMAHKELIVERIDAGAMSASWKGIAAEMGRFEKGKVLEPA
jgi:hypothetical protein